MIYTITLHPCIDTRISLDHFPKNNELIRLSNQHQSIAGGKGVNVSRTLETLGEKSISLIAAGGESADEFIKLMKKETFEKVYFSSKNVRTNYELCSSHHICEINETAQASDTTLEEILVYLDNHLSPYDLVVLAGSLPENLQASSYGLIVNKCHEKEAIVFADTSGEALINVIEAGVDYIKPNLTEMVSLFEQMMPIFPIHRMDRKDVKSKEKMMLLMDGIEEFVSVFGVNVICTLGAKGSCFVDHDSSIYSPSFTVKKPLRVKGAGDTYLGTFIYAYVVQRLPLFDCMRMASSASSAWIQAEGNVTKEQLLKNYYSEKLEEH